MRRNRRNTKYLLLLVLLLGITIGYAFVSTTLKINGDAIIKKQTWDVYWGVPTVKEGSVSMTAPTRSADQGEPANTKLVWTVDLALPGDYYEFEVDAVNNGTMDAMIVGLTPTVTPALPNYIKYSVTYADGVEPAINHLLPKKSGSTATTERFKVRVYYDEKVATAESVNATSGDAPYTFNLDLVYGQATSDATPVAKATTFQDDPWPLIKRVVTENKEAYPVGATKTFEMDLDGDGTNEVYTLRIANNTTPSECSGEGFSQTACGVVLEFVDVITTHRFNPYDNLVTANGNGNKGSWPHSDIRAYLNSTTYAFENINYNKTGLYNKLPSDLRDTIIDTFVVTGYGQNDGENGNYTSTDKIYIPSVSEVYSPQNTNSTSEASQRQLDYYESFGVVTMSNYEAVVKNDISTGTAAPWGLRTPSNVSYSSFYNVNAIGAWHRTNGIFGISPAFRIAE